MITEALKLIYNECLDGCWLDCFGVLVEPTRSEDKLQPLAKVYDCPNCEDQDSSKLYRLMIPDEKYKSLAYFEKTGNFNVSRSEHIRDWHQVEGTVNLVIWYNLHNLGYEASIKELVINDMIKKLNNKECKARAHQYLRNVRLEWTGILDDDPFEKYDYEIKNLDVYPFEWVHLSFDLSFSILSTCLPELECLQPIC